MRRLTRCILAAAFCLILSGCYKRIATGNELIFSFQSWVPILLIVLGLLAVPIGIAIFANRQKFWGVILMIAGPIAAGVVAPGMFLDKVVVNEQGFYSRHGFWFSPSIHDIRYD